MESSEGLNNSAKMRAIKALRQAEKHYYSLGYDPVESVTMIYRRALDCYDRSFPNDEADFRQWILNRQEKSMRVAVELLKREKQLKPLVIPDNFGPED